jgi:acetaldehyde dehydrogenase
MERGDGSLLPDRKIPVAVVGSGNIGTDLARKLLRSDILIPVAVVGVDPDSVGLARAREWGIATSHEGVGWLLEHRAELGVEIVLEATSASVHRMNAPRFQEAGLTAIDLTPAAVGPAVVPVVNLESHLGAPNLNMITCGGQATIPIVAAVSRVCAVPYAEIVSSIASRSAGPGTRQNIDEFTKTTARGIEGIGGARAGKAIIILNPAEPPILMRNTVYCGIPGDADPDVVAESIGRMVDDVARYVPGYRMKTPPVFDEGAFVTPGGPAGRKVTVLLEVTGSADFLPAYAGNLDIMTAAAVRVAEAVGLSRHGRLLEVMAHGG